MRTEAAPALAGVDVGTTNTKVGLYRPDGSRLALRAWPTPADAAELVSGVLAGLAALSEQAGLAPAAVGVAGMAETGVTAGADLTPLHPMISWRDPRGEDGLARIRADVGEAELFRVAGVSLGAKTPLARWRWLADTQPDLLTGGRVWLGAPDLVASVLVGEPVTDVTLAGRTGGLDVRAGRHRPDLLAAAGLSAAQLPRVVAPGQAAGPCLPELAARAGLRPGAPVTVAGHDHLVAAYAAGVRGSGEQMDSMGTAEAVVTLTDDVPGGLRAGEGVSWNRFVGGERYCLVSGFPGSGRLVDWFAGERLGLRGAAGRRRFAALVDSVAERPTGVVVEPYLAGRAAPAPDPGRRLTVHGARAGHTAADLALALLEGACCHARWMAGEHLRLLDGAPTWVAAAGGPTRSKGWMRVKAAVGPGRLRVVDDPDATCAGAALLAAEAGLGAPAACLSASWARPDPAEQARYDRFYHHSFLPVVTGAGTLSEKFRESP